MRKAQFQHVNISVSYLDTVELVLLISLDKSWKKS